MNNQNMFEMNRREFIGVVAGAATVPLAGCADPSAVLTMDEAGTEELTRLAENINSGSDEAVFLQEVIQNESDTRNVTARSPPLREKGPIVYRGSYYMVRWEASQVASDHEYLFTIQYMGSDPVEGEIQYSDLPEADKRVLDRMLPERGLEAFQEEGSHPYTSEQRRESILVNNSTDIVVVNGSRLSVETDQGPAIPRNRYMYTVTEVAGSREGFADWLREEYTFTLTGLTQEQREIVERAIDEGYLEGGVTDAFISLARRFREHRAVRSDEWGGDWLARYKGTTYHATLEHPPSAL